jgi:hypothetical protein
MIHIKLPLGPVFGTTGITVLVTSSCSQLVAFLLVAVDAGFFHFITNFISSQPSHGIIRILWSQSHCLV